MGNLDRLNICSSFSVECTVSASLGAVGVGLTQLRRYDPRL